MPKKLKFKLEITKVKLNIEQAVLSCDCYDDGWLDGGALRTVDGMEKICTSKGSGYCRSVPGPTQENCTARCSNS
ncbi:MAG: hypothetical protein ABIH08_03815 [Candidatus Omnitrophota bacterium]